MSYRVIDLPGGVFSDARPSYFHKSIGGYHGAKMRRYQEVVDNQLSKQLEAFYTELRKENLTQDIVNQALSKQSVLNMMNTRYVVINPEAAPIRNPYALGNGWLVSNVKVVANANEEIKELGTINPQKTALVDKRYEEFIKGKNLQADSSATIKLTEYQPNKLVYESDSKTEQVAVFSEMYYRGNQDWVATIDGKETPHFRADYLLRAMVIPAGKHKIEFKFAPASVVTGKKIDMFASIALIICLIGAIFIEIRKKE
ncbi:MAG: YfhO family protein [Spirosomaceae bacterium]|nr:YfhO family protein [Spirosomataceae bacterium]